MLNDQSSRCQILKLPVAEARLQFPRLVVASLGATRKDKPGGVFSARVLFDGSNGIPVNRRFRLRDQERAPVASDLKRCMREKARRGEQTFSLTADVAEAHRQVLVDRRDWHLLGCQVEAGGDVLIITVGRFGVASASYYLSRVAESIGQITQFVPGRSATSLHQLVADDFHPRSGRRSLSSCAVHVFRLVRNSWNSIILE